MKNIVIYAGAKGNMDNFCDRTAEYQYTININNINCAK